MLKELEQVCCTWYKHTYILVSKLEKSDPGQCDIRKDFDLNIKLVTCYALDVTVVQINAYKLCSNTSSILSKLSINTKSINLARKRSRTIIFSADYNSLLTGTCCLTLVGNDMPILLPLTTHIRLSCSGWRR